MSEKGLGIEKAIQRVLREKVFLGAADGEEAEGSITSLDSVGRLTLLVELENIFGTELMGDGVSPEVFESVSSVARFVEARLAESGDGER